MLNSNSNSNLILNSNLDKEYIIDILNEWNFWNSEPPASVFRPDYELQLQDKSKTNEILFLTGVRRSGKSTILMNYIKSLLKSGTDKKNILYVNLEDPRFANYLSTDLLEQIKKTYSFYLKLKPGIKPYIFLDEIQNINGFEKWLNKEYELKLSNIFITGSNSKLLSKEIGTVLSGRYLNTDVYPLSFKEYLLFKNINNCDEFYIKTHASEIERHFEDFLIYGGFPKLALFDEINEERNKKAELRAYFDSILLRDIVSRYRLNNFNILKNIAIFLLSSSPAVISLSSLKTNFNLSYDLVNNYIEYLENSFMIFRIPLFNWSFKKQQANPKKIYAIDTGFINTVSFQVGKRKGSLIENIVFLELKRRIANSGSGSEIYFYRTKKNGYEIDFLIKENDRITHLIQVTEKIGENNKEREFRAFVETCGELEYTKDIKLLLISFDKTESINYQNFEIKIINIYEWLLLTDAIF